MSQELTKPVGFDVVGKLLRWAFHRLIANADHDRLYHREGDSASKCRVDGVFRRG
ncbi:hypothetical protein WKW77_32895 [Variovorax ureilyticus]|uniref:Uncharacterized protein n=1 Tax=Variovorax ureilyticus TaxID=1836198 RepID=A0ABU8VS85_9BURK